MTPLEKILTDIAELSGARPPLSQEEYEAAQFVKSRLESLGLTDIDEQFFYSSGRLIERIAPVSLLAMAGLWLGLGESRWRRWLGAGLASLAGWSAYQAQHGETTWWELFWPQRRSTNVIGRISPTDSIQKRVVLIAHLDTDLARLSANPKLRDILPPPTAMLQKLAVGGVGLATENQWRWARKLMLAGVIAHFSLMLADESGAYLDGVNDNAASAGLLLYLAETLVQNPLKQTEVICAFTGCDTINGRGTAELVEEYGSEWQDADWIVLDSIGSGELCWELPYRAMVIGDVVSKIAFQNPAWGIIGRNLNTLSPIAPLRSEGLNAIAVMGYERSSNFPDHWRQESDTIENLDPDTLTKVWQFISEILEAVDSAND